MNLLFRGFLPKEAEERTLLPHSQELFQREAEVGETLVIPFAVGLSADSGARLHQFGKHTSGVSTTTNKEIAHFYATHGLKSPGFVAVINRDSLAEFGILEFEVSHWAYVKKPADKEVILYFETPQPFPKEIIVVIYTVGVRD